MISFTTEVSIERPIDDVFDVLVDFERYLARWAAGPSGVVRETEVPMGLGSRLTVTARVGPLRVHSPYEVTLFERPLRFGGRGSAGPVRFDEMYVLTATPAGTDVAQTISAVPRGPFRLIERLVDRQLRRLIRADLDRFRDLVTSL